MEIKKPWWKRLLEKMGIIKEQPMLDESIQEDIIKNPENKVEEIDEHEVEEEIKDGVDKTEEKGFGDSLKVEIKLTKESVILDSLKSRGVDERLLQNPRFIEDVINHIEQRYSEVYPDKQIQEVDPNELSSFSNSMFKMHNGNMYFDNTKREGQTSRKIVSYTMEGDDYINTTSYEFVPFNENEQATRVTTSKEYNPDGIEVQREVINRTYDKDAYDATQGKVFGSGIGSKLTLQRQGIDGIYGMYEKNGVTFQNQSIGVNLMVDNRHPEDLYVADAILQGMTSANNYQELISQRDAINNGYDFRANPEHREEYEAYKKACVESMKQSKYAGGLKKIADKTPGYEEKENDMDR